VASWQRELDVAVGAGVSEVWSQTLKPATSQGIVDDSVKVEKKAVYMRHIRETSTDEQSHED